MTATVFVLTRYIVIPFDEYQDFINRTERIGAFPTKEAARETLLALERGEIEICEDEDEADELDRAEISYGIWEIPLFEGKTELFSKHPHAHLGEENAVEKMAEAELREFAEVAAEEG